MAAIYRLTAVACQEVADVKREARRLQRDILEALADGVVSPQEREKLQNDLKQLSLEIDEAMVVTEEADYVEARTEYAKKRGWSARPHQYLREREADIREMGGLAWYSEDEEPKKPTPTGAVMRLVVSKRKASQTVRQSARRSDKSIG